MNWTDEIHAHKNDMETRTAASQVTHNDLFFLHKCSCYTIVPLQLYCSKGEGFLMLYNLCPIPWYLNDIKICLI